MELKDIHLVLFSLFASASAGSSLPSSCEDFKSRFPPGRDGDHWLRLPSGGEVIIYCHNMATTPESYISLYEDNYSQAWDRTNTKGVYAYHKVGVDTDSLTLELTKNTFRTNGNYYRAVAFGFGFDCCHLIRPTKQGVVKMNFKRTGFFIHPVTTRNFTAVIPSANPRLRLDGLSEQNQVLSFRGYGCCGGMHVLHPFTLGYNRALLPAVHLKYADPYTGGMEPSSPVTGCYLISPEEGTKFYKFFALTWSTRALIPYESTIFVNMTSRQLPCQHVAVTLGVGMAEENVGLEYTLKTCVHEWEDLGSDECAHHFRCTCQKVSCAVYVNVADFQANNGDWLLCDLATSWPV